jgi:hypothetical protein
MGARPDGEPLTDLGGSMERKACASQNVDRFFARRLICSYARTLADSRAQNKVFFLDYAPVRNFIIIII